MSDRDYVLGTHDEEITRLGLQHAVWRPRALDAWRRAGFTTGQTLLDVGCGPGYAALDLADIVGLSGRIIALDRSRRFLDHLATSQAARRLGVIESVELDLDTDELPATTADGAWVRWVFAFLQRPRNLLARIAARLKPGGRLVLHEYFDYSTWRLAPRSPEIEEFVAGVMASWRATGGEPDIALELPGWLAELGFEVVTLNPIIDVVPRSNFVWEWPAGFVRVGLRRLVDLGRMSSDRASEIQAAFSERESDAATLMITPAVLEIIARRSRVV
jgi:SAM-dependent methyltransferase